MIHLLTHENGTAFCLQPIQACDIEEVQNLCDECVGKNLYSKDEITAAIGVPDRFFYVLKTQTGKAVGYVYYCLTDVRTIVQQTKLDAQRFRSICADDGERVGKLQSMGVRAQYRGIGLASRMTQFVTEKLKANGVETVFSICWKPSGVAPLAKALLECGFTYLTDAEKVWYDADGLICPYCEGRCLCDAEIYYKKLGGEADDET